MPTTEERLAALETKLAALTDTTPTTYYEHQYSGEEIDAAVGRALTGGALDTSVTNVSNQLGTFVRPNLLDNWFFGRPVNQRGQTNYSTEWGYAIDRWQIETDSSLTVNNGSISLTGGYVFEPFEEIVDALKGKTVTVSLLFATGELEFATGVVPATWGGWDAIASNNHVGLQGIGEGSKRLWFLIKDNAKNILAAKLELGPTQTLAHREGDKWVLNEVPEYGNQLRRCQRYYQKFDENVTLFYGNSGSSGGTGARLFLPTAVQMRTKPVTSPFVINVLPEGTIAGTNNITFTPSDVAVVPGGVCLYGAVSPSVSIGSYTYKAIVAQLRNAPLALSADL